MLATIAEAADISPDDTVLEIGPGQGTLTSELLRRAKKVVAVELDEDLARKLPGQFPGKNLEVRQQDILDLDLTSLPVGYIVVANVPYYITSKIIQKLMTADNKPRTTVLLIQKEVAERLAARPGDMSILAISAQVYAEVELSEVVPAELFVPVPKVDSQVVILNTRPKPRISPTDEAAFFKIVKAGFSAKRKKLRSSLAGGLHLDKQVVERWLQAAGLSKDSRAQDLAIGEWQRLVAQQEDYLVQ